MASALFEDLVPNRSNQPAASGGALFDDLIPAAGSGLLQPATRPDFSSVTSAVTSTEAGAHALGDPVAYSPTGDYADVFREPVEDPSTFGKIGLRALVGRSPEIMARALEFPAVANEALTRALGMTPAESGTPFSAMRNALRGGAEAIRELGYERDMEAAGYGVPSVSGADVVEAITPSADLPIGERAGRVGRFIPETLLASAPDMVATLNPATLAAYIGARTNEVAEGRAANDQRRDVTLGDLAIAAPAATFEALLERFTTMRLLPRGTTRSTPGVVPAVVRIARELGIQGSLGGIEELAPYLAETVGTKTPPTKEGALENFVGGMLAEAGLGGTVQTGKEVLGGVQNARTGLQARDAPPPAQAPPTASVEPAAPPAPALGDGADVEALLLRNLDPAGELGGSAAAAELTPDTVAAALTALGDPETAAAVLGELGGDVMPAPADLPAVIPAPVPAQTEAPAERQAKSDAVAPNEIAARMRMLSQTQSAQARQAAEAAEITRGREAMDRVIAEQTDVPQAMVRPDIGEVSFYWGKPGDPARNFAGGHGVAKIIAKRQAEGADGEAVARHMVDVIARGRIGDEYGPVGAERVNITHGDATAVLSKFRFGDRESWLLTGWSEGAPDGGEGVNPVPAYAPEPSGMRATAGADVDTLPRAPAAPPNAAETAVPDGQAMPDARADDAPGAPVQIRDGQDRATGAASASSEAKARAQAGSDWLSSREPTQDGDAQSDTARDDAAAASDLPEIARRMGEADAERLGLREAVREALGPVGDRVIFLRDHTGLPERLRTEVEARYEQRGRRARPAALYDTRTGDVYVYTQTNNTPAKAVWSAAHEIAGHHGLRSLLGDRLNRALEIADQNPTVSAVADAVTIHRKLRPNQRMLAVEEALADLAAADRTGNFDEITRRYGVEVDADMRGSLRRAIDNFLRRLKAAMDDIFSRHQFTDEDVRSLLEAAWQAAQTPGKPRSDAFDQRGLDAVESSRGAPVSSETPRTAARRNTTDGQPPVPATTPGTAPDVRDADRPAAQPGAVEKVAQDLRNQWDGLRMFLDGRPRNPESIGRRLNDLRAAVFSSIMSRARTLEQRNPDAPALRELLNQVMAAPGDNRLVLETVNDAIQSRFATFTNRVRNILGNNGLAKMSAIENAQLRAYLLGTEKRVPANVRAAGDSIRRLMDVQREDMLGAGIDVGEVQDVGYLTRIYDEAKILNDADGFTKAARELYEKHEFALEVGRTSADIMYGDGNLARFLGYARRAAQADPVVRSAVDEIKQLLQSYRHSSNVRGEAAEIQKIVSNVQGRVAAFYGEMKAAAWLHGINTPDVRQFGGALSPSGAPVTRQRELSGAADTVMAAYLKTDMLDILDTYARTAARKIEHASRFGPDGSRLQELLDRASEQGVPKADLEQAMTLVDSVIGLRRQPIESKLKAAADFIHAWSYIALLGRATFTSLAEAITYSIRTGNLAHVAAPLIQIQRAVTRSKKGKALNEMAQTIAVNGHKAVEDVIMNRLGGDYAMTPQWSRLLHRFFYSTLLTPLTRAQRAYGVGAATGFLRSLARNVAEGREAIDTAALLNEVGIADHRAFAEWMLAQGPLPDPRGLFDENGRPTPRGQDYMVAVRRIVDQSIQNPGAEHRPAWTNNPTGRLVTGIMSFSYSAYENIIRREAALMARNLRDEGRMKALQRNGVALAGASALVVGQTITSTIREILFNSARFEDKDDDEIAEEMIALGLSRTFGLGSADPLIQYLTGLKYQRSLSETVLGAGPGMFARAADTWGNLLTDRNSENTDTAEFRAAQQAWTVAIAPALNIMLSRIPLVGGPAIMAISGRDASSTFAEQFARKPEANTRLDRQYREVTKDLEEVLDVVNTRIAALPKEQWQAELDKLQEEFPSILAGVTLDTYADNPQNRGKGRVGEPKTAGRKGKPGLRLQGPEEPRGGATTGSVLGELEGYERYSQRDKRYVSGVGIQDEITDLNRALRNIKRADELTIGNLIAFTEGSRASDGEPAVIRPQSVIDMQRDVREGRAQESDPVSKRTANAVIDELQRMRRERKRRAMEIIDKGKRNEPITRGEGRPG